MFGKEEGFAEEVDKDILENESKDINVDRQEAEIEEKIDLLDLLNEGEEEEFIYFDELEDVEDPRPKHIVLAEFIRERTKSAKLTSKKDLIDDDENIEETLAMLKQDDETRDIVSIEGAENIYYYSNKYMTDNYAMIAMFVEDKDLSRTIAEMVRWNCKTYPCPTPTYYFNNTPYFYTDEQINLALQNISSSEKYQDIEQLVTGNNVTYLYSTLHMSRNYAKALAESTEYGEYGY